MVYVVCSFYVEFHFVIFLSEFRLKFLEIILSVPRVECTQWKRSATQKIIIIQITSTCTTIRVQMKRIHDNSMGKFIWYKAIKISHISLSAYQFCCWVLCFKHHGTCLAPKNFALDGYNLREKRKKKFVKWSWCISTKSGKYPWPLTYIKNVRKIQTNTKNRMFQASTQFPLCSQWKMNNGKIHNKNCA